MQKLNIAIIFGGKSNEHEISCQSALSIIQNINIKKYNIYIIWIDKQGQWFYLKNIIDIENIINKKYLDCKKTCFLTINKLNNGLVYDNFFQKIDCIFPVVHGKNGEDGVLQGLFELSNISYVGCNLQTSSICMNKNITKLILSKHKIPIAKYVSIKKKDFLKNKKILSEKFKFNFPVFIKPTCSGSSIGAYKCDNFEIYMSKIKNLFNNYNEIMIEEYIDGTEIEVGVIGNDNIIVSTVGEIKCETKFYDYNTKYITNKIKSYIPALISSNIEKKYKNMAKRIFNLLNCKGLARIDFFLTKNNKIIFNEINTMPGFTANSMFPKLFENIGINYSELIDHLIKLALEKNNYE